MTTPEILASLVTIPTPSSASNLPLVDWVSAFLVPRGWKMSLFPYADENGTAKANLIARPAEAAPDSPIGLAFICHTDTVPFAPDWAGALQLELRNGHLHGCGACDVKGSLACFLAAVTSAGKLRHDCALILTADEEIGCKGLERLLAATQLRIASALVSEPTSLHPGIAGKGYGLARVTVRGVEAHSAFPAEGLSAIKLAARFILELEAIFQRSPADANPGRALFDPPRTTINIGTIQGGSAKNIIAGACTFLVEWRPIPSEDPRAIPAILNQLATRLTAEHPRAAFHIEALRAEPGFAPATEGPLQQRLRSLSRRHPVGISFGSEASRLARIAEEVIVIGPGDMHTAHSARECVPLAELEEWTETLRTLLCDVISPDI